MSEEDKAKFCTRCGKPITADENFCRYCGARLAVIKQPSDMQEPRDKQDKTKQRDENIKHPQESVQSETEVKPASKGPASSNSRKNSHGYVWLLLLIVAMGLFITKPWIPRGESDPEKVMTWCYKHDTDIFSWFEHYQMNATYSHREVVLVMKNKKSNSFVFKYKGKYVYLIRIIDPHADMYAEQVVGLSKDKNGGVYHHTLEKTDMNPLDDIAVDGAGWTATQFVQVFEGGE